MRRGRLEGRWMGKAPAGYVNKIREDKTKYIELQEPEASHIKWAFKTLAEGTYATDVTWNLARERGMKCKSCMNCIVAAQIEQKRYIIGSIFPAKWTIFENKGRTEKVNLAALLIYQINNTLRHKKSRS